MGNIILKANELLSLIFNGQFIIQPFVINEAEFRIPCLGNGLVNDDNLIYEYKSNLYD